MLIQKYVQGRDNKQIFGNVSTWLTSQSVHEELGMAITSKDDDFWYLAFLKESLIGFAVTRKIKSTNAYHVRFVYADPKTKNSIIQKILKDGQNEEINNIWTNDRETEQVWKELNFSFKKRARGSFGRWEKSLKNNKKEAEDVRL